MSTASRFEETGSTQLVTHANWCEHNGSRHAVQFYSDDRFLVESLASFFGAALREGDAALVIATPTHLHQVYDSFLNHCVPVSSAEREGRYVALGAAETLAKFMRNTRPDPQLFQAVIGGTIAKLQAAAPGRRIVAFGEMVALLWADDQREAALELEQLWNNLAQDHEFSLRCAYPLSSFGNDDDTRLFLKICAEHSSVMPGESYTSLADDNERLRNIAQLQQKAQALEFEKGRQASLRNANSRLEAEAAAHQEQLQKSSDAEKELRELSARLLRSQDEERRRLGLDLHDSVGQYLAVLKMGLDMLNSENPPAGDLGKKLMAECIPLLEHSIEQLRVASYLLYPPMIEETGLRTAIQWYLTGFVKNTGIRVTLDVAPAVGRLPGEIELALFRVLQESLANVHQHSRSSTAAVSLRLEDGFVRLKVSDEGKGIAQELLQSCRSNPGKLGVGFRAMQERLHQIGGQLQLSSPPQGTTLTASVPLTGLKHPPAEPLLTNSR